MTDTASDLLAPDTGMGAVTLRVGDLDAMIAYYRDGVTLELLANDGATAVLGRGTTPIIILQHAPELKSAEPRSAGLFHTAIVFDSQTALALAIYSVATRYPGTFTGSADHLVSEAFYFTDPEGNGVELYWDRVAHHLELGARPDRDGDALPRPERLPAGAPHRGGARVGRRRARRLGRRRPCAPLGRRCGERTSVLRRQARLRDDGGTRRLGAVRLGRRLPPPHGHEHLEQRRRRQAAASPSVSARSTSWCRASTTSEPSTNGCGTTA